MPTGNDITAQQKSLDEHVRALLVELAGEHAVTDGHPLHLESLDALRLKSGLEARYGVDLPLAVLLDGCTAADLVHAVRDGLAASAPRSAVHHDERHRHDPFPLTDVQQAYWLGADGPELGGRSAHLYLEINLFGIQPKQAEDALNQLIQRHDMLRAVLDADGAQRVLPDVPVYRLRHGDLRGLPADEAERRLQAVRAELSGQVFAATRWPLYDIRAHSLEGERLRLHLSIDLMMADATSIHLLITEWIRLMLDPAASPAPFELTFRDVVLALHAARSGPRYERAGAYWLDRLDNLPPAPQLPIRASDGPADTPPRFTRRQAHLCEDRWRRLRERARTLHVTPSVLLCAAYAEVLSRWSATARFTLNLTLADRPSWHPDIPRMIGDFTNTVLLECDLTGSRGVAATAAALQARLRTDLEHTAFGGVRVQRELARRSGDAQAGARARMPVVFTSLLQDPGDLAALRGVVYELGYAISQTPQVFLDNQAMLTGDGLTISWDAVEALFPAGTLDEMFAAYLDLLDQIADGRPAPAGTRLAPRPPVEAPAAQLHTAIDRQADARPDAPAVITADRELSFAELDRRANQVAHRLRELGVRRNQLVGIVMHKGWEQVVAALGITRAGAAYLPIDAALPPARIGRLVTIGRASAVVTQPAVPVPAGTRPLVIGSDPWPDVPHHRPPATARCPDDLAYVIFTSGSTGTPKGVMIGHRGAANTVAEINHRLAVDATDRVLGVSSLSFDLSVYDVFGVLGAGGAIVLPDPARVSDPGHLAELAHRHQITLWNTVPGLLELAVEWCERTGGTLPPTLRAVLISGDWIPLSLPDRTRALTPGDPALYGLGGATEAAIWSVCHPITRVDPNWRSIPYGRPLRNQTLHILGPRLEPKPTMVPGELYIGGAGVAQGYWADPARTAEAFVPHPATGERLYRTGDIARYLPDGAIEFLGRQDGQVKLGGRRIELGEVEATLGRHPDVRAAVVVATGPPRGPQHLVAYVVPRPSDADALIGFLAERLPAYMLPARIVPMDALPLTPNGKIDRAALPAPQHPGRQSESPATPSEESLAGIWQDLLGVSAVGRHDNFFRIGGDSLLGVRALARAAEAGLHLTMREIYEHPTIAEQATLARSQPPDVPAQHSTAKPATGPIGLTPSQQWFLEQGLTRPDHWNGMWPMFALRQPLEPEPLTRALAAVLEHHGGLRTRLHHGPDGWRARIIDPADDEPPAVQVVRLPDVPDDDLERRIGIHVAAGNAALDLAHGPVVRLTYFDLGPGRDPRLLVSAHWLVMDYYSSRVFYEDLQTAYFALARGDHPRLPPPTASLHTCVAHLAARAANVELAAEAPYWTRLAEHPAAPLPVDHRLGRNTQSSAERHFVRLTGDLAHTITARPPGERKTEIRDLLIIALVRTVTAWTGHPELLVELEGHGREWVYDDLDTTRTVGRLSTLSPALLRLGDLDSVRGQLAAIPHRGVGYGLLRHLHPNPRLRARLARAPSPQVGFNFWGEVSEYFTADAHPVIDSFGHHRSGHDDRPRVLDLTALTVAGELWLIWNYSANLHSERTIRMLADRYTGELTTLAGSPRDVG